MILCIDIGNTNIVLGCYRDDSLLFLSRIATSRDRTGDQYAVEINGILELHHIETLDISGAVISSVVPALTGAVKGAVKTALDINAMVVGSATNTGLAVKLDHPAELGSDLAATAVAAKAKYTLPCIIIDMGTATKITVLDKTGAFIGGAIAPGLRVSVDTLVSRTSMLVDIALDAPDHVIGTSTIDCMKSGAVFATAALLDGMCERMSAELGQTPAVVATGGLAGSVIPFCKVAIVHDDTLLLEGLRMIYEMNSTL